MSIVLRLCLIALLLPMVAHAGPATDRAATCLTDSTSGKDRKALVKWMFLAISKHPEISSLSAATAEMDTQSNQEVGQLYTRLIADDCAVEIKAMVEADGPASIAKAFEVLGGVAMQELMEHPEVEKAFSHLDTHMDQERIRQVFDE